MRKHLVFLTMMLMSRGVSTRAKGVASTLHAPAGAVSTISKARLIRDVVRRRCERRGVDAHAHHGLRPTVSLTTRQQLQASTAFTRFLEAIGLARNLKGGSL